MSLSKNFTKAIAFVLKHEGGYVNDPSDPGGETKFGISKRAYPGLDIKNLTEAEAIEIYRKDYWNKLDCEDMSYELALITFDCAVNQGVRKAILFGYGNQVWQDFLLMRIHHYVSLAKRNPSMQKYLRGWLNRCMDCYLEVKQNAIS